MKDSIELRELVERIREELPEAAAATDVLMRERGFETDAEAEHIWVEAFADITNRNILERNADEVCRMLRLMSACYETGPENVRNCIEVGYVENLMWDISDEDRQWVWPRIPDNLKGLYIAMWGDPALSE